MGFGGMGGGYGVPAWGGKGKGGGTGGGAKVFVGGLNKMSTVDALTNYFSQYGTLVDVVVMKNGETGESRGFGFVQFDAVESVEAVLEAYDNHHIDGKWVEVKRADGNRGGGKGGGGFGGGKGGGFKGPFKGPYW